MDINNLKLKVGTLYRVNKNYLLYIWHPDTKLVHGVFVEPSERRSGIRSYYTVNQLKEKDIFMYVGERIGPNSNGVYFYKILYKDKVCYTYLQNKYVIKEL
jgi:hypothetical protein